MGVETVRLHSLHNPGKEAERFVSLSLPRGNPRYIVITEPGESHTAAVFRAKFPDATLITLRYTAERFMDTDPLWDFVWRPGFNRPVMDFLFQIIPEEYLPRTVFLSWKPSDTCWPDIASYVWHEIAELIKIQSAVIRTRTHFGKRWLKNSVSNMVFSRYPVILEPCSVPVLLACAGPSLETIFPIQHDSFFVVAVSSALGCLLENGVQPDLCITTDGGYWAREHFRACPSDLPIALPPEAALPRTVLDSNPVFFLSYSTALEESLFRITGIVSRSAQRNGTVSGTAAELMLRLSDKPVVTAGLDLVEGAGFTHARPHSFDPIISSMTTRTTPLPAILRGRAGNGMALDAYAHWFATNAERFSGRLYRETASIRIIPQIPTASLASFTGTRGSFPDIRPQPVSSVGNRAHTVAGFLLHCAEQIRAVTCFQDADPLLCELVQLVSFPAYLSYLTTGDCLEMCTTTGNYLEQLAKRIPSGGK